MTTPDPSTSTENPQRELVTCDRREFTLSWDGWPSSPSDLPVYDPLYITPEEWNAHKRMVIASKLAARSFGLSMSRFNRKELEDNQVELPDEVPMNIVMSGVRLVRAFFDDTSNTGIIKAGQPVVFDTVTGSCVTGIHHSWSPAEYTILGIAFQDFWEIGYAGTNGELQAAYKEKNLISVLLQPPNDHETGFIFRTIQSIPGRNLSTDEIKFGLAKVMRYDFKTFTLAPSTAKRKLIELHDGDEDNTDINNPESYPNAPYIYKRIGNPFSATVPNNATGFATKDNYGQYIVTALSC